MCALYMPDMKYGFHAVSLLFLFYFILLRFPMDTFRTIHWSLDEFLQRQRQIRARQMRSIYVLFL